MKGKRKSSSLSQNFRGSSWGNNRKVAGFKRMAWFNVKIYDFFVGLRCKHGNMCYIVEGKFIVANGTGPFGTTNNDMF